MTEDNATEATRTGNPHAVGDPFHGWWERETARVAALEGHHARLLARERSFLRTVARRALDVVPDAIELRLFGSRATMEHRRGSDWDFMVVAPALDPDRRIRLSVVGGGGTADMTTIEGRRVDLQPASAAEAVPGASPHMDGMLEHSLVVWSLARDGSP